MISRVYVAPRKHRKGEYRVINSYLIDHELSEEDLVKAAAALTNPILEIFSIDRFPNEKNYTYAIEIGFLPGVTDNVGHTAKETIIDLLRLENPRLEVYTSRVFLIPGKIKMDGAKDLSLTMYNPLIERAYIASFEEIRKNQNLPKKTPEVVLARRAAVLQVSLKVSDEELERIGTLGIQNEDGTRRGPLALDLASMKTIQQYFSKLKRDPFDIELESLAQTWSEHCKHTIFANPIDDIKDGLYKTYIKGATNLIRKNKGRKDFCVSVFSDNAGGIAFDDEYLITHKVETHNSPSALDPFGGAITGIVGVNRDCLGFGLGAKPVANTYGFCFGYPEDRIKIFRDKDRKQEMFPPKRIMEGVIKGINVGGNCSGIPTTQGFLRFDDRFKGKPLVFAGTVGLIPRRINHKLSHEKKALPGDYIVVVGGRVGADGIHGATFSSVTMDSNSPAAAVQIGDPITQKKLSDAIIREARAMDLYNSITDNGAGGISCSVAEMAKECGGAKVNLEKVPLKYPGLRPWEIWISESQERMTLSVPKKKWPLFQRLMQSRGVEATVIGEFTDSGKCVVTYNSETIMDMALDFLHNGLPKRHLEASLVKKSYLEPAIPKDMKRTKIFEELVGVKNVAGFGFVSEQYDHEVQAGSVIKPISGPGRINTDAQVLRPLLTSKKGAVVTSSLYPSYGDISTYHMSACAIDTAVRNAVAVGAQLDHLAILDNFCWCSSNEKERLGELVDALRACYKMAVGFGAPFISGKDSMFNDFKGYDEKGNPIKISIPPTLLISAISVIPDIYKTTSPEFKNSGDVIYLLGETNDELGGGEYYKLLAQKQKNNAIGNNVPEVNIDKNLRVYRAIEEAIRKNLLESSISVASGGLAVALAKGSLGGRLGCTVSITELPGKAETLDAKLFSESQGRILVSVSPLNSRKFEKLIKEIPHAKLGSVSKDKKFIVRNGKVPVITSNTDRLYKNYHAFSKSMSH